MSKVYGLTGGIATGKSTVLKMFAELGCQTFDADKVAREVVKPGSVGLKKIVEAFGDDILLEDGSLNRSKLGQIVFSKHSQLAKLNSITGPLIRMQIVEMISGMKESGKKVINIFEIPLLFEAHYEKYFDGTIVAYLDEVTQLERLIKRNDLSKEAASKKIAAQMSTEEKKRKADFVIDTKPDLAQVKLEVEKLLPKL